MASSLLARLSRLVLPLVFGLGVVAGCADAIPDSPLVQGTPAAKKNGGSSGATAATAATAATSGGGTTSPTPPATTPSSPGGSGASSAAPTLTAIAPDTVTVGAAPQGVDIAVTGKGFAAGTQVDLAGAILPATVLSATQLAVHVPGDRMLASGVFRVTVIGKQGASSNPLTFTVANPTSVAVVGIAPSVATAGDTTPIALTVSGSGFVPASVVRFNGATLATTFRTPTELGATIPASALLDAGKYGVSVANGADVVSLPVTFEVKAAPAADAGASGGTGSSGAASSSGGAANPACVYACDTYGYAPGQCFEDWYCIPDGPFAGCLGQTACN